MRLRRYVSHGLMHVADFFPSLLTAAARGLCGTATSAPCDADAPNRVDWRTVVDEHADAEPAWQLGDGVDVWAMLSTGAPSPRTEVLLEAHPPGAGGDDGNGQAIVVGELKLIWEKGPQWHGPPNDLWYESGSNPSLYSHTVRCTQPPPPSAASVLPPCLFNLTADPCEYVDLKQALPDDFARLQRRLALYQATAVSMEAHRLPMCASPSSPLDQPVNGTWMPVCP